MSNLAAYLRQEITRLARKEAKAQTQVLRKANAQYRRDIAELKRHTKNLAKQVAFLEQQEKKRGSRPASGISTAGKRFSRRGLIAHRRKVGMSAADYGILAGVSAQTVYNWESAKSKPREQQLAALIALRELGKREAARRLELAIG